MLICNLKAFNEGEFLTVRSMVFHSLIVDGKYDFV